MVGRDQEDAAMKEYYARMPTNELDDALDALWDSPEDLHLIRRELRRRKTRGAARLRTQVEARLAEFEGTEPQAGTSAGSSDEADLKGQISRLKIEVGKLRKMARLKDDHDYLYTFVGAHPSIPDHALEALRGSYMMMSEAWARAAIDDDDFDVKGMAGAYRGVMEEYFDEIERLRSEQRRSSGNNGQAPTSKGGGTDVPPMGAGSGSPR